jgi:hypothetical protein
MLVYCLNFKCGGLCLIIELDSASLHTKTWMFNYFCVETSLHELMTMYIFSQKVITVCKMNGYASKIVA